MKKAFIIVIVILCAAVIVYAAYVFLRGGTSVAPANSGTANNGITNSGATAGIPSPGASTGVASSGSAASISAPSPAGYGSNAFGNVPSGAGNAGVASGSAPNIFSPTPTFSSGSSTSGAIGSSQHPSSQSVPVMLLSPAAPSSSLFDYLGSASEIIGNLPTGNTLAIGTPSGTVVVANFYASNPPMDEGGDVIIKETADYLIVYDPSSSRFWLAITGTPFATWQNVAEQDFLRTLDISESEACELYVTSGVIYSPGDPNDGLSFPPSFCDSGAFGG